MRCIIQSMIHNASNHPVLVKKIGLQIWTLRAEIEAIIAKRMVNIEADANVGPEATTISNNQSLENLHEEYHHIGNQQNLLIFPQKTAPASAPAPSPTNEAETTAAAAQTPAENPFEEIIADDKAAQAAAGTTENTTDKSVSSEEEVIVLQRRPMLPDSEIFMGKTLLSEIYMDRIHFFCDESFLEGQNIVIQFMIPQCFTINADVMYCRRYGMKSRIISENKLLYRVAARFTYLRPGERTLLRRFLLSIEPSAMEQLKAKANKEAQNAASGDAKNDDVMGDLENLDL